MSSQPHSNRPSPNGARKKTPGRIAFTTDGLTGHSATPVKPALAAGAAARHLIDKVAVDLQLVKWELLQMSEAGGSGSKVIKRDPSTEGFEVGSNDESSVEIIEQRKGFAEDLLHQIPDEFLGLIRLSMQRCRRFREFST